MCTNTVYRVEWHGATLWPPCVQQPRCMRRALAGIGRNGGMRLLYVRWWVLQAGVLSRVYIHTLILCALPGAWHPPSGVWCRWREAA